MTGLPAGIAIEIEFVAGTWTDVTADVDAGREISWRIGRTSPVGEPGAASVTVVLFNTLGRYTPQRQVLADGVTVNPLWPNVEVRKRLRISYTVSGRNVRFVGDIKQWRPGLGDDGHTPLCYVLATDRLDRLARVELPNALVAEMLADGPASLYQLTEAAGSTQCVDTVGKGRPLNISTQPMALGAPDPVPLADGLTGLQVTNSYTVAPPNVSALLDLGGSQVRTLEAWVKVIGATAAAPVIIFVGVIDAAAPTDPATGNYLYHPAVIAWADRFTFDGGLTFSMGTLASYEIDAAAAAGAAGNVGPFVYDSQPHHYAITQSSPGVWSLYYDGAFQATLSQTITNPTSPALRIYCQIAAGGQQAVVGPIGVYTTALSAGRIAAHYAAGNGNPGELSGARAARVLGYAGLTAAEINVDAGRAVLGPQALSGQWAADTLRDIATSEGGGAVFYVASDGRARFPDRAFRKPGAPGLTVDAGADLLADAFDPAYDELTLVTSSTVTRDGGTPQTFTDTTRFDLISDSAVTLAATDQAALNLAQWRVRSQNAPALRLAAITVDMLTATTANLYQALAGVQIGTRIRVTSLDATVASRPVVDLVVEGWTETIGIDRYTVVFDTSAADTPPQMIWNDTTNGRWQADGQTLTAAITSSATSLSVTTAAGKPKFTTNAAAYPMQIQIGQEVITLPSAPTGTAPQVFSGVSRGQASTPAAPQSAGSVITLYPASAWTL